MMLSEAEELFVKTYINDAMLSGQRAVELADLFVEGESAHTTAQGYLSRPSVREEVNKRVNALIMQPDEVMYRVTLHARAGFGQFLTRDDDKGAWKLNFEEIRDSGFLVKSVKQGKGSTSIDIVDSQRALEMLAKYHKLLTDKLEIVDWRSEVISLLKAGTITPRQVVQELGEDIALEILVAAGVQLDEVGEDEVIGSGDTEGAEV